MNVSGSDQAPSAFKQSRTKLWIRTLILVIFGTLFALALYPDIVTEVFPWLWAVAIFLPCLAIGFWMRRLVPMQVHMSSQHITLSFDRIYFTLIVLLVLVKAIAGRVSGLQVWADTAMCVILGLMIGRLSGICLRVRGLKVQHNFSVSPEKKTGRD